MRYAFKYDVGLFQELSRGRSFMLSCHGLTSFGPWQCLGPRSTRETFEQYDIEWQTWREVVDVLRNLSVMHPDYYRSAERLIQMMIEDAEREVARSILRDDTPAGVDGRGGEGK